MPPEIQRVGINPEMKENGTFQRAVCAEVLTQERKSTVPVTEKGPRNHRQSEQGRQIWELRDTDVPYAEQGTGLIQSTDSDD